MPTVYNERVWNGHVISWIHELIREGRTVFQDATNDAGLTSFSGATKFPDVLLFSDRISGLIFNGWELKFPDTRIDDPNMLENAIEKAQRIGSNSFVTWNGSETIIWKIENDTYNIESLTRIKVYPNILSINSRNDLSLPENYNRNAPALKNRLFEILHDLEQLLELGEIRNAINVSNSITQAIKNSSRILIPQFRNEIISLRNRNRQFREEYNRWRIYENSTIRILNSSSRRIESIEPEEILAKFTFYNLIGKLFFYLTLSENLSGNLNRINIESSSNIKVMLSRYFDSAKQIDYSAVFQPYFTDDIEFNDVINQALFDLLNNLLIFDFRILPSSVIGEILENLVPKEEKQKLGQYFTPEILTYLVSFPAINDSSSLIFDPTSGTGSFLNSVYRILNYYGNVNHEQLLNQIWGNDISHFPAILSVINLYKQKIGITNNFPRVIRDDFFNLTPGVIKSFPNPNNLEERIEVPIPIFDAIISNFPFIQQEDIPNDILTNHFRREFEQTQQAFLIDDSFKINERSDYFTYCTYNSLRFLNENGHISIITSNAWLGKEYGIQFKKFLLDNFHIKYIVKSSIEHWFSDSKVSTIFLVLQKVNNNLPTKFISFHRRLADLFDLGNENIIREIEDFYSDLDNCNLEQNTNWTIDSDFNNLLHNSDNSISVSIIEQSLLIDSIQNKVNWSQYFISANIFNVIRPYLIQPYPNEIDVFRGERTGWNQMFIIPTNRLDETRIEEEFLVPYLKSSSELDTINFSQEYSHFLFVCDLPIDQLENNYPGAYNWIQRFANTRNSNGTQTIEEACSGHRPFWYSLRPKRAHIVTSINPYKRLFFSYSVNSFTIDQRLASVRINDDNNVEVMAALLNSVFSLLALELKGTSRNLGALDINANYLKNHLVLNPNALTDEQKNEIIEAFNAIKNRKVFEIFEEINLQDRIDFDRTILRAFNIDETILPHLYKLLISFVSERVSLKDS
jgi:hypothetical protein